MAKGKLNCASTIVRGAPSMKCWRSPSDVWTITASTSEARSECRAMSVSNASNAVCIQRQAG